MERKKEITKTLNGIGWRWGSFVLICIFVPTILSIIAANAFPQVFNDGGVMFSLLLTLFLVQIGGVLYIKTLGGKMEVSEIAQKKLGFGEAIRYYFIMMGIVGVGMIVGYVIHTMIIMLAGGGAADASNSGIAQIMMGSSFLLRVFVVGICAPIAEELIFRKFLIDRLAKYGEAFAVITSGLMFGMFHGNFQQFFLTTGMGMLLAYIYLRTGKVIYTIIYHAALNLMTSVITISLAQKYMDALSHVDMTELQKGVIAPEAMPYMGSLALFIIWLLVFFGILLAGFIVWMCSLKKLRLNKKEGDLTKKEAIAKFFTSPVMWVFILACVFKFVDSYLPYFMG